MNPPMSPDAPKPLLILNTESLFAHKYTPDTLYTPDGLWNPKMAPTPLHPLGTHNAP